MLADGWDFIARTASGSSRNTEQTNGAVVSYDQLVHPGVLRIPVDAGDLWDAYEYIQGTPLFRDLPTDWTSIRLKIASFTPVHNYQQAGLLLYQDDDNYVQISRIFSSNNLISLSNEVSGRASVLNSISANINSNLYFRIDRDIETETINAYYSLNNTDWIAIGSIVHVLNNPRLAIIAGGDDAPGGYPNTDIAWAEISNNTLPPTPDELRAHPGTIVFHAIQGQPLTDTRSVFVFTSHGRNISWTPSADVSWLSTTIADEGTEGILEAGVNTGGLTAGLHQGNITLTSPQSSNGPVVIPVILIINPDVPVKVATWKDGIDGAMSVSVDDGEASAFDALQNNGFKGTYVSNHIVPPSFYTSYYNAGMELGSHLTNHPCEVLSDDVLRTQEIVPNISGLCTYTPQPCKDIITLAWSCGVTNFREQAVASEYFLSARGYNFNELEDATPKNFMNLKSFNSHEHTPYPPSDLKTVVDNAVTQKKWFNLILHSQTNDNGAIDYARSQNIWVTSIGNVIKYILQRDRFILTDYVASSDAITFHASRLSIPASTYRSFETAFNSQDITTLQIDIDDNRDIVNVFVDGAINSYQIRTINNNKILFTNVKLDPAVSKAVEIRYFSQTEQRIYLSTNTLNFITTEGTIPGNQSLIITSPSGNLNWTASVGTDVPLWLNVTPGSGTGTDTIAVQIDITGLTAGTYNKTITIESAEAINSPQTVNVTLKVNSAGILHYDFTYADRNSMVADGWDFNARTPLGDTRNTEQTSGGVVSYDQAIHPGVIRIPVDLGDLWQGENDTRNSLV